MREWRKLQAHAGLVLGHPLGAAMPAARCAHTTTSSRCRPDPFAASIRAALSSLPPIQPARGLSFSLLHITNLQINVHTLPQQIISRTLDNIIIQWLRSAGTAGAGPAEAALWPPPPGINTVTPNAPARVGSARSALVLGQATLPPERRSAPAAVRSSGWLRERAA